MAEWFIAEVSKTFDREKSVGSNPTPTAIFIGVIYMNTFIISDTHFCHENVIKYCGRPFQSASEMDNYMVKKWNNIVSDCDIVYHLGDFCFGGIENVIRIKSLLNGRIRLILGNHDRYTVKRYYEIGFDRVYDKPIIFNNTIMSHRKIFDNVPDGYICIHGHTHNNSPFCEGDYQYNVSVENINYAPLNIKNFERN